MRRLGADLSFLEKNPLYQEHTEDRSDHENDQDQQNPIQQDRLYRVPYVTPGHLEIPERRALVNNNTNGHALHCSASKQRRSQL